MGQMIPFPKRRYNVIYADPPWDYGGAKLNAKTEGKELADHYDTMQDDEILSLPVKHIADRNCLLFMWVVYAKLPLALQCFDAWGFRYSTVAFEWPKKTSTGLPVQFMGRWVVGGYRTMSVRSSGYRIAPKQNSTKVDPSTTPAAQQETRCRETADRRVGRRYPEDRVIRPPTFRGLGCLGQRSRGKPSTKENAANTITMGLPTT